VQILLFNFLTPSTPSIVLISARCLWHLDLVPLALVLVTPLSDNLRQNYFYYCIYYNVYVESYTVTLSSLMRVYFSVFRSNYLL